MKVHAACVCLIKDLRPAIRGGGSLGREPIWGLRLFAPHFVGFQGGTVRCVTLALPLHRVARAVQIESDFADPDLVAAPLPNGVRSLSMPHLSFRSNFWRMASAKRGAAPRSAGVEGKRSTSLSSLSCVPRVARGWKGEPSLPKRVIDRRPALRGGRRVSIIPTADRSMFAPQGAGFEGACCAGKRRSSRSPRIARVLKVRLDQQVAHHLVLPALLGVGRKANHDDPLACIFAPRRAEVEASRPAASSYLLGSPRVARGLKDRAAARFQNRVVAPASRGV